MILRILAASSILLLLLLISPLANPASTSVSAIDGDAEDNDLEYMEELLSLDQQQPEGDDDAQQTKNEAEVWRRAQRVVLELNADTTTKIISQNEFVLVLGYAPWCDRSAQLMPQFAHAAMSLKAFATPPSILMAKIDAERYPKAASFLGIKGFPTLLLFVNGTSIPYTGAAFSADDIVIWARKKTGVPVIRINSVADAQLFLNKYSTFAFGLFQQFEGPAYLEFLNAATLNNDIQFAEVSDLELAKLLYPEMKTDSPFLGLVKSEPERFTTYGGVFKTDCILKFVDHHKFPLVNILTESNSAKVYSSLIKLQVFVFAKAEEFERLQKNLQDIARKFLSEILFILVDIAKDNLAKPLLTLFGIEESDGLIVVAFSEGFSSKYLLEGHPIPTKIEEFCTQLIDGTLQPYFKSQPVPDNNKKANILTVVGKTFDDLVLNNPKNVLLEVHTPWCINCEATSRQVEKLAKHFKGLNSLVFARIDASVNEHPKLEVDNFPTIIFYPVADKLNPIKLSTKSGVKELAASINKHVKAQSEAFKDEL